MPTVPVAASHALRRIDIRHHDRGSGRWVRVAGGASGVRVEVGGTGNRLDPERLVRLAGHDLDVGSGRAVLRAWWPVQEIATHRTGQFLADLRGELGAAGSADPGAELAQIGVVVAAGTGADAGTDAAVAVLRVAYPLLARPLADNVAPEVVPVPVETLLRHADTRSAVQGALSPRPTRPLIRALVQALLPRPGGPIAWEPVVCALMAAMRCGPEQLTAILSTATHHPGAVDFTVTDVDRARAMFSTVHPRRVAETLVDSLAAPGGTARLQARIAAWDPRPPAPPAPPQPHAPAPAPRPPAPPRDPGSLPIAYPSTWRAVEGQEVEGFRIVLPRTGDELLEWGARMDNCLGAYRNAAATGRTRIMGFTCDGDLRLAAEISASRILRQLEAPGNTRPGPLVASRILGFLRARHLVEADARRPT